MRKIARIFACALATAAFVAVAPAVACIPQNIAFAYGKTSLDAVDLEQIDDFAESLRKDPARNLRLIIESDGSQANVRMARVRAEVVKRAFVRRGVPASMIVIATRVRPYPFSRLVFVEVGTARSC